MSELIDIRIRYGLMSTVGAIVCPVTVRDIYIEPMTNEEIKELCAEPVPEKDKQ